MDQLRADALAAIGWTALDHGHIGCWSCTAPGTSSATDSKPCTTENPTTSGASTRRHTGESQPRGTAKSPTMDSDSAEAPNTDHDSAERRIADGGMDAERGSAASRVNAGTSYHAYGPRPSSEHGCGCRSGHRLASQHGRAASIQVTVPITTLLGASDEPAELAGYGPITAEIARQLAAHGTWRRLLTDPASGAVLEHGRQTYRPPHDLAELVLARDQTCRHPTCEHPARLCDIDHTIAFHTDGGTTHPGGLGALCRSHHTLKDDTSWRLEQPEPGLFTWHSPSGHTYRVEPETVGLITTPPRPPPREPSPTASGLHPVPAEPDHPPF